MSQSNEYYLALTALGKNRSGIVNDITHHVSQCGCNIADSRLALLGEEFTFIMLLSGSWNAIAKIESSLPQKGVELDLLIVMKRTTANLRPKMPIRFLVEIEVKDSPGLIEQFTNIFDTCKTDIAELISKTLNNSDNEAQLSIQMTIHTASPDNLVIIKQDFVQLCRKLNAQGTINILTLSSK